MKLAVAAWALCLASSVAAQEPVEVPFRLIDGWAIVLEGTLGGIPHQRMLLDTGAVPSAINIKLAKQLGLFGFTQRISAVNRPANVERVRVPGIRVGVVNVNALDMNAIDLERIEQRLGTRLDAIIGLDVLGRRNFKLDYRRKKLVFDQSAAGADIISFEMKDEAGGTYLLIPLESGGEKLQMLLDTGAKNLTLFAPRLRGVLRQLRVRGRDFNLTAAGQDPLVEVEMESLTVGPVIRRKQRAYVLNASEDELREFDGLLGPVALGASTVAFDFDRHAISFQTR